MRWRELEDNFDDDRAEDLLNLGIYQTDNLDSILEKSMFEFSLDNEEGVLRLLELLPVLDEDILKEVYRDVFRGYPVENLAPRIARAELRGYFMDFALIKQKESNDEE